MSRVAANETGRRREVGLINADRRLRQISLAAKADFPDRRCQPARSGTAAREPEAAVTAADVKQQLDNILAVSVACRLMLERRGDKTDATAPRTLGGSASSIPRAVNSPDRWGARRLLACRLRGIEN